MRANRNKPHHFVRQHRFPVQVPEAGEENVSLSVKMMRMNTTHTFEILCDDAP